VVPVLGVSMMAGPSTTQSGAGVTGPTGEDGVDPRDRALHTTPGERGEEGGATSNPTLDESSPTSSDE
jgi:hypothetical protein